ncbi:Multidrug ABC transporter substrate-binding protein [Candidatus Filomicrobium marinum]|uniref:Multidrug ABC transporter substrate-binding protein n=1 Tax=Candidatus Filomicrobium marinum TaxID=1608628 RepID=A0A0D6JL84_9HYPH|nr:ABC transporter permease [Candidatus Filomicrobium marinum]CFX60006.1 Multidrug ABC transporter substrate-binding protein [Candidatus Filomicrobium marinum]CPR22395.1 Multidrug ABC transporter substrate-binding protein [Candidatus Filomicrobium marinum]
MVLTLAFRNLFHDRVRLTVTLVGILFSIVLVAVQLGLYLGASRMITANIDQADATLWITAFGAKSFEDGGALLSTRERHQALATPGVVSVTPIVVKFAEWRKPEGGSTRVVVVGSDAEDGALKPWNLVKGTWEDIKAPDAIAVDRTYLSDLGVHGIGDSAQIDFGRVKINALTDGIRSFTQSPYVYMPLSRARQLLNLPSDIATFHLVKLAPNADVETVRKQLLNRLESAEVLTKEEFHDRSLKQWLFRTGAGVALIGGALLGILVGTVIVAQTLYSSTKDHINEFATLRALGSSSGYIHKVILAQAGLSAILGYMLGMILAGVIVFASQSTPLPILMTPQLAAALFTVTVFMCAISAISAIVKVTKIDPATVFSR